MQIALHCFREATVATLNMRLDDESKAAIAQAASLRGVNVTEYIRAVLVTQARREVEASSHGILQLTADEQLALWRALEAPPALTEHQRQLGRLMRGDE
jgi:uncharacterized protein (DUF1778 family)